MIPRLLDEIREMRNKERNYLEGKVKDELDLER